MSLKLWWTDINGLFLWSTKINQAYLWSTEVFSGITSNWLLNNLISYYEFENNVLDSEWSNNWTNFWTSDVAGIILRGRWFDWVNDYITISNISDYQSDNFSFSIWFNSNVFNSNNQRIIWKDAWGNTNWDWQLRYDNANNQVVFQMQDWSSEQKLFSWIWPWDIGTWYNILVTATSTEATIYVDSVEVDNMSITWSNANNTNDIQVWRHATSWSNFFNWEMDEFWFWDRTLDQTDANNVYNSWNWLPYWDYTT